MPYSLSSLDLKYYLCPGSNPEPECREIYEKVYGCWKSVWTDAFRELQVSKTMNSDAFTRQDLVGAIFHLDQCVALCFFRWAHAQEQAFREDSYFFNWSDAHIEKLLSRGDRIIICSYFTVHPAARGQNLGVSGKDLLTGIAIETFLNSGADAMTGAVRVNRKVNEASARWGGYEIAREIPSGVGEATVDLMGYFKDHILAQKAPELKFLVKQLWRDRVLIPRQRIEKDFETPLLPAVKKDWKSA